MATLATTPTVLSRVVHDLLSIQDAHKNFSIKLTNNGRNPKEERIGEGSFGSVFLGEASIDGHRREVVIKIARMTKDCTLAPRKRVTRLLREVVVWSVLNHCNVATFLGLDFSDTNVKQLMVMDASTDAPDHDLTRGLRMPGLVSPHLKWGILEYVKGRPNRREACVTDLARGLTYLHQNYVIHGDLRPENIRVDHDGVVKLIDFGFSKLEYCSGFTTGSYSGLSLRFTAPEVIIPPGGLPSRPTFKSDIYSFSMCMLQVLVYSCAPPHLSVPFNHLQQPESAAWKYLQAICMDAQRPLRENYPAVITDSQWNLMVRCWSHEKNLRLEIHQAFENLSGNRCTTSTGKCWL
ncbi:kinase-like protein [Macrolepiota fuliginosa MF-IS2]|uniref:Kinase-like protein n=1 Tax=Macrolepiota fuliginosa MF-IS2 TaxID=1400762 RepID=A0A9P5XFM8_9AGAR|nr:kinase-like protein [Macrolepiota fuliginosa MF-IS2]